MNIITSKIPKAIVTVKTYMNQPLRMECIECEFQETLEQKLDQPLPPVCKICKNILRPSVILFGEPLNPETWEEAERLSSDCDVMFIVGTSLNVGPVNQLPLYAKRKELFWLKLILNLLLSLMKSWIIQFKAVQQKSYQSYCNYRKISIKIINIFV